MSLEDVRLRRRALPEADLEAVSLRTRLLDRTLQAPLVTTDARAAADHGLALVLAAGEQPAERPPLLLAGLDALEVVGREGAWRAEQSVEVLDADGLAVRLDPLGEATRPGGEASYAGVLEGIAAAVGRIAPRPLLVTGVTDFDDAVALRSAGVTALGVGGAADAIADARAAAPGMPIIAAGIRDGLDVAKCLALGATAASVDAAALGDVIEQLRIATWLAGAPSAQELGREHLR